MNTINYNYNWNNKLASTYHTTIRLRNDKKYVVGQQYMEKLKSKELGVVQLIDLRHLKIDQLNDFIAGLDTGYSLQECKNILLKMYPNYDFKNKHISLLLLRKENASKRKSTKVEPSQYTAFSDAWFNFYTTLNGVSPKFSAKDGKALKEIIKYLNGINESEEEAFVVWQQILNSWNRLDEFYRKSPDLSFINSQFNKIINNLKNYGTGKTAAGNSANDLRQKL